MMTNPVARRWVTGVALAALMVTTAAPAAQAKSRRDERRGHSHARVVKHAPKYKVKHRRRAPARTVIVRHEHHSSDAPAIIGFIGGLVLGTVLSNAQAEAAPAYDYYDPYCDRHFESLVVYRAHFPAYRHPRVVRVIEVRSGDCRETLRYRDGDWHAWNETGGYWDD